MKKSTKNYAFKNLSIKENTATRFRKFASALNKKQSTCLQLMLDFFEQNRLSPTQDLGPNMSSLEQSLKKRIDGFIAILRDIEKTQTKPTQAMLEALFEATATPGSSKPTIDIDKLLEAYELSSPPIDSKKSSPINTDLINLLENTEYISPALGRPYLRLNITRNQFELLKAKYHVHKH
ncbi:BfmA/BtgA family mobilization protein [Salegentibacter sp. HM20]